MLQIGQPFHYSKTTSSCVWHNQPASNAVTYFRKEAKGGDSKDFLGGLLANNVTPWGPRTNRRAPALTRGSFLPSTHDGVHDALIPANPKAAVSTLEELLCLQGAHNLKTAILMQETCAEALCASPRTRPAGLLSPHWQAGEGARLDLRTRKDGGSPF